MHLAIARDVFARFAIFCLRTGSKGGSPNPNVPSALLDEDNGKAPRDTWDRQGTYLWCKADFGDPKLFPNKSVNPRVYPGLCTADRQPQGNFRALTSTLSSI